MTRICLIAGEPSGDFLGARLIDALRVQKADLVFSGVGGPQMSTAGLNSLFPYEDLSVMGIAEILPKLPLLVRRINQTVQLIKTNRPDIVVSIDSPDFCFRVIKRIRAEMTDPPKLIHYVAPTVWAWRENRAAEIARFLDGLICLFDFEPPYFERHGLKSIAAGHPLVEGGALAASGDAFRDAFGIVRSERVVGVLLGSRKGELERTGAVIRDAAYALAGRLSVPPHLAAPTLPHLKDDVARLLNDYPGPVHVFTEPDYKYPAFKAMDVALAVSGTVGLELAALQVPHVIAYKASPVTALLIKRLVKVRYAHLANIMADKEIVPEFLQENCEPGAIAAKAFEFLMGPQPQKDALAQIAARIGAGQSQTPSQKAAAFVLSFQ